MAKKKKTTPRPRHVWEINPKSRIKPSDKQYQRTKNKKRPQDWLNESGK